MQVFEALFTDVSTRLCRAFDIAYANSRLSTTFLCPAVVHLKVLIPIEGTLHQHTTFADQYWFEGFWVNHFCFFVLFLCNFGF